MNRIIHFEIPASKYEKSISFYKSVFNLDIQHWKLDQYMLDSTGDNSRSGIDAAFLKLKTSPRIVGYVNTTQVEKKMIPALGYLVNAKNVERTLFGLMQEDANAK